MLTFFVSIFSKFNISSCSTRAAHKSVTLWRSLFRQQTNSFIRHIREILSNLFFFSLEWNSNSYENIFLFFSLFIPEWIAVAGQKYEKKIQNKMFRIFFWIFFFLFLLLSLAQLAVCLSHQTDDMELGVITLRQHSTQLWLVVVVVSSSRSKLMQTWSVSVCADDEPSPPLLMCVSMCELEAATHATSFYVNRRVIRSMRSTYCFSVRFGLVGTIVFVHKL